MEISIGRLLGAALPTLAPNTTADNTSAHPRIRFYVLRAGLINSSKARSLAALAANYVGHRLPQWGRL